MKIIFFTSNRADIGLFKNLFSIFKKNFLISVINLGNPKNIQELSFFKNIKIINIYKKNFSNSLMQMTFESQSPIIKYLKNIKPDLCFIPGDRMEMLSPALCCHFLDLKIAHLHGGELTHGSKDDTTRHTISKLSHIHFPASFQSYKRVLKLGERKENVFLTGCPSLDLINSRKLKIDNSFKKNLIYEEAYRDDFFF